MREKMVKIYCIFKPTKYKLFYYYFFFFSIEFIICNSPILFNLNILALSCKSLGVRLKTKE